MHTFSLLVVSPISDSRPLDGVSKQSKTFSCCFSKFCSTLVDIKNLLKYFVASNIIKCEEQDNILAASSQSEMVRRLLMHIAGPLEAGINKPLLTMLDIMEQHGVDCTRLLASSVRQQVWRPSTGNCYLCVHVIVVYSKQLFINQLWYVRL